MIALLLYGCGLGLQPMDKLYADTGGEFFEPAGEPSGQPTNEPSTQPSNEPASDPNDIDNDGDGFSENEGDCNDNAPNIGPNQSEIPYDGSDNDCDPTTPDDDLDEDGFDRNVDCDDLDENINPNAVDNSCDGLDDNCDGQADEGAQPDIYEPFDVNTPNDIGSLNDLNDTVFAESYLFPLSDDDAFEFWFEDDSLDCIIFFTDDPDHFTCTVVAPTNAGIQVDLRWQQDGDGVFQSYDSLFIPAGDTATFEGGSGDCGYEDGGTFRFEISAFDEATCLDGYTISCIKDDD